MLRASGVDHDLRRDAPYHIYDQIKVKVAVESGGDCLARYKVRVAELRESIRISRLLIDNVPEGPSAAAAPSSSPAVQGQGAGRSTSASRPRAASSAPIVIAGGGKMGDTPYRLKIRPPSLHALVGAALRLPGALRQRRRRHPGQPRPDHGGGRPMSELMLCSLTRPVRGLVIRCGGHDRDGLVDLVRAQVRRRACRAAWARPSSGPLGLLQPIADACKLLQKEDLIPGSADAPSSTWRRS
jgi:hypothetical protein